MDYFILTLKHKWYVLLAGLKFHAPLFRLILHDLSKFSFAEYPHYQKQFFGKGSNKFNEAWIHHQNHNDHHWEYWIPRTGHDRGNSKDNTPVPMSYGAVMEMVADWIGASKAYSGQWPTANSWPWLDSKVDMLCKKLHITTFVFVLYLLNKHNLVTPVVEEKYLSQLTQVVDINSWNRSKDKDVYLWLQNKYKGGQYV